MDRALDFASRCTRVCIDCEMISLKPFHDCPLVHTLRRKYDTLREMASSYALTHVGMTFSLPERIESLQIPVFPGQEYILRKTQNIKAYSISITGWKKSAVPCKGPKSMETILNILSERKVPMIFHNGLCDVLFLVHQCMYPLPEKYDDCRKMVHDLFPILIDTKYNMRNCKNTSLPYLYDMLKGDIEEPGGNLHEPWYDSFMTYIVYINGGQMIENKFHIMCSKHVWCWDMDVEELPRRRYLLSEIMSVSSIYRIMNDVPVRFYLNRYDDGILLLTTEKEIDISLFSGVCRIKEI